MLDSNHIDWHLVDCAVKEAQSFGIQTNRADILNTMIHNGLLHQNGAPTRKAIHKGAVVKHRTRRLTHHVTYLSPHRSYYLMLATVLECFDTALHELNATDAGVFHLPRTIELLKSRQMPCCYHSSDWSNLLFASYLLYDDLKQTNLNSHDLNILKIRFDIVCNRFMQTVKADHISIDDGLDTIRDAIILEHELG